MDCDFSSGFNPSQNFGNGLMLNEQIFHPDPVLMQAYQDTGNGVSSGGEGYDDSEFSYTILKFINEVLMEEDLDGKTGSLQDCLALQAAEQSFYDVLVQEYRPSLDSKSAALGEGIDNIQGSCVSSPSSIFGEVQPAAKFIEGIEEANKFLPKFSGFSIDLESIPSRKFESANDSKGKKTRERENSSDLEEDRSNKQAAGYVEEFEQSDLDAALLCSALSDDYGSCFRLHGSSQNGAKGKLKDIGKKKGVKSVVDFSALLTQCAQAVSSHDQRIATELVKQIRQHSSPTGDGSQRLADFIANALEARMCNDLLATHTHPTGKGASARDIIKSYHMYISVCPFKIMSNFIANRRILKESENVTSLHIIDLGIMYGFQWPCLIKRISERPGGPPKIRITGIELPQPGFRPSEHVEETGRRLKNYCERFQVQFEYHVIAQKWETIKLEDLKIDRNELTVVNCLYRLKNLADETLVVDSPRDKVLNLIRQIKPDLFIHGILNGTYSSPFFLTRFREALFHFSSLFDMFDANIPRENRERMLFEKEIFARDIMNVVACEGWERVERPESYKQWQVRNVRAGFKQLPLDQDIFGKIKQQVKTKYHKDFVVDKDGHWMLQGWKGRIIYAISFWKPNV